MGWGEGAGGMAQHCIPGDAPNGVPSSLSFLLSNLSLLPLLSLFSLLYISKIQNQMRTEPGTPLLCCIDIPIFLWKLIRVLMLCFL